jgi:hypothetical protein
MVSEISYEWENYDVYTAWILFCFRIQDSSSVMILKRNVSVSASESPELPSHN